MDQANYDPTDGLNTDVEELVRCYVRCAALHNNRTSSSSFVTLYSSERLLAAQLYALEGYILDDSPSNFNHYQAYIAQALQKLPEMLREICHNRYVVYHVVKAKLTEKLGEAMFCILKPAVQQQLELLARRRYEQLHRLPGTVSVGKLYSFLNTYFRADAPVPDWTHDDARAQSHGTTGQERRRLEVRVRGDHVLLLPRRRFGEP